MSVREYIGARYVPLFADPIEWDNTKTYEPLTIVYYQGNSYTSKQAVPTGIAITNTDFWALTGNYNAQIEAYREEVETYSSRLTSVEGKFDANGKIEDNLVVTDSLTDECVTDDKLADDAVTTAKIDDGAVTSAKLDDGAVTTGKLASNAVTTGKIQNNAVTTAKIADGSITPAKLAGEVIVIFGDSWAADDVADVTWPAAIASMFGGAQIHNYAVNGCRTSNGTFQEMYQAFVNDNTYDKSTITRCILVYGVNDFFTTPIDSSNAASAIDGFANAVLPGLPANVPVHWFINVCFGKHSKDAIAQMEYWHRVMLNISSPRILPHETWSWFNVSQFNQNNYFHLKSTVYGGFFARNMYSVMTGGEPERLCSWKGAIGNSSEIGLIFNVNEDDVEMVQNWTPTSSTINYNLVSTSAPIPIEQTTPYTQPTAGGAYTTVLTGSSDAVNVNRITFIASAPDSALASNRTFQNLIKFYPMY